MVYWSFSPQLLRAVLLSYDPSILAFCYTSQFSNGFICFPDWCKWGIGCKIYHERKSYNVRSAFILERELKKGAYARKNGANKFPDGERLCDTSIRDSTEAKFLRKRISSSCKGNIWFPCPCIGKASKVYRTPHSWEDRRAGTDDHLQGAVGRWWRQYPG